MKKLLLGLALGGLALGGMVAANNVKAAENFSYKQDFDYKEDYSLANDYYVSSGANSSTKVTEDGYIEHTFVGNPNGDQTDPLNTAKYLVFKKPDGTPFNTSDGKDVVLKMRFKSNQTYTQQIRLNFPSGNGVETGSATGAINLLYANSGYWRTDLSGTRVDVKNAPEMFSKDTWYDLTVVIDNNEGLGTDVFYIYINNILLFDAQTIKNTYDLTGDIYQLEYMRATSNKCPEVTTDIDYFYIGEYNGATASVESTYNTSVGQSIAINPTLTGTNPDYDASISYWTPVIEDESKLIYDSESGKFEGLAEGSTTVTFDFADPLIQDVTTTVNVGAAQGETKVEDIELSEIFANDTITLVPGESYDLDDLLTVSPVAATNKELNYVAASDSNSIYSLDGSVVTATAKGTSTLTVNSADGNATKTLTIKVEDGYLAQLPTVGTTWDETNVLRQDANDNYYMSFATNGKAYGQISVIDDSVYGSTLKIVGAGSKTGNSVINHFVPKEVLEANANYKLVAIAKVDNPNNVSSSMKIDIKAQGVTALEVKDGTIAPSYDTANFQVTSSCAYATLSKGWSLFETTDVVNMDAANLWGLKLELNAWNHSEGLDSYITHVKLVKVDTETALKSVVVTSGEQTFATNTADAQTLTLNAAGATSQINISPIPSTAVVSASYESDNEDAVTVSAEGLITAVNNGTALITATVNGTKYYLNVTVSNN